MIDFTKPLRTRDGRKVRILCTDRKGWTPIVGLIINDSGETIETWSSDGTFKRGALKSDPLDLVNINEGVLWVNVYDNGEPGCAYATREEADEWAVKERLARVKVPWREGQFDE